MNDSTSPVELVLALVRVVNGDVPRLAAQDILDPMVEICMDSKEYRGIDVWYKWIYLIRNCGRIADLRMTQCRPSCDARDPSLVHLSARWTGTIRSRRTSGMAAADGEVEFIFGRWIRYSVCFQLFLVWSALHFMHLSLRRHDYLVERWRETIARPHRR
jgi:hypothetical protein